MENPGPLFEVFIRFPDATCGPGRNHRLGNESLWFIENISITGRYSLSYDPLEFPCGEDYCRPSKWFGRFCYRKLILTSLLGYWVVGLVLVVPLSLMTKSVSTSSEIETVLTRLPFNILCTLN